MRYRNLDGSGPQPFANVFRWGVTDKLLGRRRKSPASAEVPRVDPDVERLKVPPKGGEGIRLMWLGHASWLVQLEGVSLLIDPVLGPSISGVVRRNVAPGVSIEQLPRIDASLVSHDHRDHLDMRTVARVGAPMIAGGGSSRLARKAKVASTELEWWASTRVGDVKISFVPSQHWSGRGVRDHNDALWGGFVIEGGGHRLYHSGDTAYFGGFREIGERLGRIDAALLPIGAYDPQWFMGRQHMNPEEAVQAFEDLKATHFFAMHWGTFKLTDEPLDEPPRRLRTEWSRRQLSDHVLHVLPVGGVATLRGGQVAK